MEPGKLSFSTFQLNIDNIAFTKNALQAFNITFPYKNIEQVERRSKKVFIDIKHNNYLCMSINEGRFLPISTTVYNKKLHKEFPNKRTSNEAEWEEQFYVIYDFTSMILYISNSKKKGVVEEIFKSFLINKETEIEIVNIYKNPDEFIKSINNIKKIKFTRKPDKQCDIQSERNEFDPRWAIDADSFYIELNYTDKERSISRFRKFLSNNNSNIIRNLICIGYDDNNFEKIFKVDQFLEKVHLLLIKNDRGFYEDDIVFLQFMRTIETK